MIETIVKIDGMMCAMCEAHMNDAFRNAFKVKKVSSSHIKGESVILSEDKPDEDKLRETVEKTGYKFVSVSYLPYEKKGLFSKLKK